MTKIAQYLTDSYVFDENQETQYIKDVLVDADALVALAKSNDTNHKKAVKLSNGLQKIGANYYFSPFTVAEAATVLSYKTSHQEAKKFLEEIRKLDAPVMSLSAKDSNLADKWFLRQKAKGISYFDCYNLALLDRYRRQIVAIFSFDSIYRKNGFTLLENLKPQS